MKRPPLSEVLDDAIAIVPRVSAPWLGVLWLTAVPLRLVQADAYVRVADLGSAAGCYGSYLAYLSTWITLLLFVSLWGRAVFVRAVYLDLRSERHPAAAVFRVPAASLAVYFYAALTVEVACYASIVTVVALPAAVVLAGLAAVTAPLCTRPSLLAPWREILSALRGTITVSAIFFVCVCAWLLAVVNLLFASRIGVWLAGSLPGVDVARWSVLLSPHNLRYSLALAVGGALAVEPFWLAALSVFVHKMRARTSGDDLRAWFDRIRGSLP
ncbi:MAG: hypothetical protein JXO72_10565 [Vicinamibacteria bacterium]|nr:hypothetical protein [Vicinamibacteria bacterium]